MVTRYHPILVALHWLLAAMVIGALLMGGLVMSEMPNDAPDKIGALQAHMSVGIAIGLLMLIRLVVRLRSRHPAEADIGLPVLNRIAKPAHLAIYALVIAMAGSGVGLSLQVGLPDIVFGGQGTLPADFHSFPARIVHGWIATVLALLVAGHVAAAFYHQIARKDGLMSRMSFGPREG